MFQNSLDNKPIVKKADGVQIKDLTKTIFDFNVENYVTYTAYKVPSEYVMRSDLISQAVYNNTLYAEFILKYNGISNPFTIDRDDIILIPALDAVKNNIKKRSGELVNDVSEEIRKTYRYIDPTKKPIKDERAVDFEGRSLTSTGNTNVGNDLAGQDDLTDGALPPNIADTGSSQITVRNGRVYFGEGIGQSACLKNGMTNSEFLTKVIKSRQPEQDAVIETPAQRSARIAKENSNNLNNR